MPAQLQLAWATTFVPAEEKDGDSYVTDGPRVADCPLCSSPAEAARLRRAGEGLPRCCASGAGCEAGADPAPSCLRGSGCEGSQAEGFLPMFCPAGARPLPEWVPDSTCSQCSACRSPFTLLRRRHHCRSCGRVGQGWDGACGVPGGPSSAQPLSGLSVDLLCPLLTEYCSAALLQPEQTRTCLHPLLQHAPPACIPLCPEPVRAPLPDSHRRSRTAGCPGPLRGCRAAPRPRGCPQSSVGMAAGPPPPGVRLPPVHRGRTPHTVAARAE